MAVVSVRKFSVRKPTWISFRAGLWGGLGYRGERVRTHSGSISAFHLKDLLYLAISGRWIVVG